MNKTQDTNLNPSLLCDNFQKKIQKDFNRITLTMSTKPTFHIRRLGDLAKDGQFMIDAYDSTLPQLAAIGSGGQWGLETFSEKRDLEAQTKVVVQAKRYQETGEGDPVRIFLIEAEVDDDPAALAELPDSVYVRAGEAGGKKLLAVGSVMLSEGIYPSYLRPHFNQDAIKKALDGTSDYVYLEALITDYRAGKWRKGAGAALIEFSRQYCREKGKRVLYGDSYSGNDGKLVKYYEGQGFHVVDYFEAVKPDGSTWPGAFFGADSADS